MMAGRFDDALAGGLAARRHVLLAISGGPDSTALLLAAHEWASRRAQAPTLSAATIDHGLRAESAAEAAAVAGICAELGLPHAVLSWVGPKPKTRVQERAREVRRKLLAEHAARIGADAVALAHHRDDQAETVLFRLARGSGVAGMAGMAAITSVDGVEFVRPLLDLDKDDLVALCTTRGIPFSRDPSNEDCAYARVRFRALTPRLAAEGLDAATLARFARRAARAETAVAAFAQARAACWDGEDARALFAEPEEIALRLLGEKLTTAGAKPLRLETLERLTENLRAAAAAGRAHRANVGGLAVSLDVHGSFQFAPEPPRRGRRNAAAARDVEPAETHFSIEVTPR